MNQSPPFSPRNSSLLAQHPKTPQYEIQVDQVLENLNKKLTLLIDGLEEYFREKKCICTFEAYHQARLIDDETLALTRHHVLNSPSIAHLRKDFTRYRHDTLGDSTVTERFLREYVDEYIFERMSVHSNEKTSYGLSEIKTLLEKGDPISSIKELIIQGNDLSSYNTQQLEQDLKQLPSLTSLMVRHVLYDSIDGDKLALLFAPQEATIYDLSSNPRIFHSSESIEHLARAFEQARAVSLAGNCIGLLKIGTPSLFGSSTKCKYLDLKHNLLSRISREMMQQLFSPFSHLQHLDLSNNLLGCVKDPEMLHLLFSYFGRLKSIDLSYNSLDKLPTDLRNQLLVSLGQVEHIDLSGNNFCVVARTEIRQLLGPLSPIIIFKHGT